MARTTKLTVKQRTWLGTRFGVYSEPHHTAVARYIAGFGKDESVALLEPTPDTQKLAAKGRAVLLVYPVRNAKAEEVSVGFVLVYPKNDLGFLRTIAASK